MKQFTVIWMVEYIDDDATYTVSQTFSGKDVDDIFDQLNDGLERGIFMPEANAPFHESDLRIEYVKIIDKSTNNVLYVDKDFNDSKVKEHFDSI